MRKTLVLVVLALLLGAGFVWVLRFGSGYVLVTYAGWTMEMSLWTAVALQIFLVWFLVWGWLTLHWIAGAGGLRAWWHTKRTARHLSRTAQGLLLFAEDDWAGATAVLEQSAKKSRMPAVNLLYAARGAANNREMTQARRLLEQLKQNHPEFTALADKTLAESLLTSDETAEATRILQKLQQQIPDNRAVLKLLVECYQRQKDWAALEQMLGELRRLQVIDKGEIDGFTQNVYSNLLATLAANARGSLEERQQKVRELWKSMPKDVRRQPDLVLAYASALKQTSCNAELEQLLVDTLNRNWDARLVRLFGQCAFSSGDKQLAQGEKWLSAHSQDASLLLALGRICRRQGFRGKARDYLQAAKKLDPSPEVHKELADLLADTGDASAGLQPYRQGAVSAVGGKTS